MEDKYYIVTYAQTFDGRRLTASTVWLGTIGRFLIRLTRNSPGVISEILYSVEIEEHEFKELGKLL